MHAYVQTLITCQLEVYVIAVISHSTHACVVKYRLLNSNSLLFLVRCCQITSYLDSLPHPALIIAIFKLRYLTIPLVT